VLRRSLVRLGAAVLALGLAAPALAARVHVRVEGPNATVFGPTEPLVTPVTGTFAPPAGPSVTLDADTPLGALERASRLADFYYRIESFSFGPYVAQVGRRAGSETSGWVYKVNGVSPPVSATAYRLQPGDRVLWYHATFGASGGPRTLDLQRTKCRGGVQAVLVDDAGRATPAEDVVFLVDGRRVRDANGALCPRGHWHTLRATSRGAVRSEVVRAPRSRPRAPSSAGAQLAGRS
jgi:hypothetical protein